MKVSCEAQSHLGFRRDSNQDSFAALPDLGLFVVADGMGGHMCGELASSLVVGSMEKFFRLTVEAGRAADLPEEDAVQWSLRRLVGAVNFAQGVLCELAATASPLTTAVPRMGTTVAALHVAGSRAIVAHVGDSRCYWFRDGALKARTTDHTVAAELEQRYAGDASVSFEASRFRHVLTRALGTAGCREPEVDATIVQPRAGDLFLLCSDGLSGVVSDEELTRTLSEQRFAVSACSRLVKLANERGGEDNVTAVLVKILANEDDLSIGICEEKTAPGV